MEKTFGKFLENLRTKTYSLSRKQLCEGICSEKQLERIERNISEPSVFLLHQFSSRLNTNLICFYQDFFNKGCLTASSYTEKLFFSASKYDLEALHQTLNEMKNDSVFSEGANFSCFCYGQAVNEFFFHQNYLRTISLCVDGIQKETSGFFLDIDEKLIYSDAGYAMLNLICGCYRNLENFSESKRIASLILDSIRSFYLTPFCSSYFSSEFAKKLFLSELLQMARAFYEDEAYEESLDYVSNSLSFSFQHSCIFLLPELYELKYQCLLGLNRSEDALMAYNCAISLFTESGFPDRAGKLVENALENKKTP